MTKRSLKPRLQWEARVDLYFLCPDCGLSILEGNPVQCPHQDGPRAFYNSAVCGTPINWEEIQAKCHAPKGGTVAPKVGAKKPTPAVTMRDVLNQECPKGG